MDELVKIFLEESEDEIRELETGLMRLEEDSGDEDTINRVFRAAHTIKGSAGLVGFEEVSNYTHTIESILDRIRKKELTVTKALVSSLLGGVDFLKRMISAEVEGSPVDSNEVEEALKHIKRFLGMKGVSRDAQGKAVEATGKTPEKVYLITMKFRPDILSTGQDPLMLIRELMDMGEIIESRAFTEDIPGFYELQPTTCYTSWEIVLKTSRPISEINNVFIFVMDENEISIHDISSQYKNGVDLSLAEKPIGEILVEKGIVRETDVIEALREHKTTGQALVEKGKVSRETVEKMALAQSESRKVAKATTIRVDTDKLDRLMNLVGEMVISVARVSQCANEITDASVSKSLTAATASLERISRDLQEQVMRVRMVPVEGTFNRFKRVVRDMSFELGKKIEIKMSGTETELD
ncbi:MAG TPA: Hpt domain-containing protein, partial [Deltaproteobacteria bacterium]|nr:Hpt domain-containing protein [Deltaproteobacteria bacterium]